MRSGLIVRGPQTLIGGAEGGGEALVFVDASEARSVMLPSVFRPVASVAGVEVGVAVVDTRVLGYVDVAPERRAGAVARCILVGGDGREPFLVAGLDIEAAGAFLLSEREGAVTYEGRPVPVVRLGALAARVQAAVSGEPRERSGGV